MIDLIFSSVVLEDNQCRRCITDCFFITAKGAKVFKHDPDKLSPRERQLLRLISHTDAMNRQATQRLLDKVDFQRLINKGVIEQKSPCTLFCFKLQNYQAIVNQIEILAELNKANNEDSKEKISVHNSAIEDAKIDPCLQFVSGNYI